MSESKKYLSAKAFSHKPSLRSTFCISLLAKVLYSIISAVNLWSLEAQKNKMKTELRTHLLFIWSFIQKIYIKSLLCFRHNRGIKIQALPSWSLSWVNTLNCLLEIFGINPTEYKISPHTLPVESSSYEVAPLLPGAHEP